MMLTFDEAQALVDRLPITEKVQSVPLSQALGRVLAGPVLAASDQPPFDRATMDGYAVVPADPIQTFAVVGTVLAGDHWQGKIEPGQCVRIMTGAPAPANTTVVPIERTDGGTTSVTIEKDALVPGKNIAWRGQDAKLGQTVLQPGTWMAPQTLAAAAMAGADRLDCFAPPSLGLVTTGNEIGSAGPAGVRNSNGPYLSGLCQALRLPHSIAHAQDEEADLRRVLGKAADSQNIVVTVGGVSMGSADLVPKVAEELGFARVLHRVAMQPGKPVYLAQRPDGTLFLGLPGNPVSVLVTAHLFLVPLIGRFLGNWRQNWQVLPLGVDHQHRGKRRLFLPARLSPEGVSPVQWNGSGDFYSAARGDGLIDLEPGGVWQRGDTLRFLPFLGHLAGETGH